ncbi:MAG: hypothetical protein Q7J80_12850, partial [Anaerolineales bacterium]|nr:hypothetical protein [Anaerolineales bacterium]
HHSSFTRSVYPFLLCEQRTEHVASLLRTAPQAGQFSKHALVQSILRDITVQEMHEAIARGHEVLPSDADATQITQGA